MHTRITELSVEKQAQFSMTLEARRIAVEQFQNARQPFEGAIGAIDCTHVAILAPREHKEAYINHNGYHSLNVQMPDMHAYIWSASATRGVMERAYHDRGERRTYLICDSGYPLEPCLLTSLPHEPELHDSYIMGHYAVQEIICLSKHMVLQYEPGDAVRIVNACAVLHNMRIAGGILDDPFEDYANGDVPNIHIEDDDDDDDNVRLLALARQIQDRLIAERFGG
ncbi:hypothetical protein ACFW04_014389 [Cataglyphis niger]